MFRSLRLLIFAATISLVSCVSPLSQPQPKPSNYEAKIKASLEYQLKDAEGARYKFQPPFLAKTGRGKQWVSNFAVNGTNSFGGYTGYQRYMAYFANGEIQDIMSYAENPFLSFVKPVQ